MKAFWSKVEKGHWTECWPYNGTLKKYGRFGSRPAHRVSWEIHHESPFPKGKQACHSCDNPGCVNPHHIWPGTHRENMQDRDAKGRNWYANYTHCVNGHEYTPENTFINKTIGRRGCKECRKIRMRDYHARNKTKILKRKREQYARKKAEAWKKECGV